MAPSSIDSWNFNLTYNYWASKQTVAVLKCVLINSPFLGVGGKGSVRVQKFLKGLSYCPCCSLSLSKEGRGCVATNEWMLCRQCCWFFLSKLCYNDVNLKISVTFLFQMQPRFHHSFYPIKHRKTQQAQQHRACSSVDIVVLTMTCQSPLEAATATFRKILESTSSCVQGYHPVKYTSGGEVVHKYKIMVNRCFSPGSWNSASWFALSTKSSFF